MFSCIIRLGQRVMTEPGDVRKSNKNKTVHLILFVEVDNSQTVNKVDRTEENKIQYYSIQ
jgi:hypothetical protein